MFVKHCLQTGESQVFDDVNWPAVGLGAFASFILGWFWCAPNGFYPLWSASAKVRYEKGDPMGAGDGPLVLGLLPHACLRRE